MGGYHPQREPELLAPAGNWDCARAAVAQGAQAIYFGLPEFNARLRADNFTQEDLPALMGFLHRHGVKGYVTMNTLVFTSEWEAALTYLRVLESAGVDGVIVQDLGLAHVVKQVAPRLELHASTQMTLTSGQSLAFVKRFLSLDRAVLARELSLSDIAKVAQAEPDVPLEIFVHGALCVAYSGQCLTSENLGQRSANRGECAQACRLPYKLVVDGVEKNLGEKRYLFSPQDLCALDCLEELMAIGVKSYKIEGRLKSPEYVAAVTGAYHKALEGILEGKRTKNVVSLEDRYGVEMVFSRGLTTGWLQGTNHPYLTHGKHGKKRGAWVGRIREVGRGWVELERLPLFVLQAGDGFVFDAGEERNSEQGGRIWKVEGKRLYFHGKASTIDWQRVHVGQQLWKTDDPVLNAQLRRTWNQLKAPALKVPLSLRVSGRQGEPICVQAWEYKVEVKSEILLQRAEHKPLTEESLKEQLGRLGTSSFELAHLDIELEEGLILPLSALNQVRRELVEHCEALLAQGAGGLSQKNEGEQESALSQSFLFSFWGEKSPSERPKSQLHVLCRSLEQLSVVLAAGVDSICLEFEDIRLYEQGVAQVRACGEVPVFLATPRIEKPGEEGFLKVIERAAPDGVLVRHLAALEYFHEKELLLWGDFSLNATNPATVSLLLEQGRLMRLTLSYDLNQGQVLDLLPYVEREKLSLSLHQHMPLFHTEHCVFCTFLSAGSSYKDCGRPCEKHKVWVKDRVGIEHRLFSDVGCRNTLFAGQAQSAARLYSSFARAGVTHFRLDLLDESPEEVETMLRLYKKLLAGEISGEAVLEQLHVLDRLGVTEGK